MRHRIPYGSDPLQFGDLRTPAGGGAPVAVVIHGGFWRAIYDLEYLSPFCEALTEAGVATWSLEYRRLGNAGGGWPGTFEDAAGGTDYLRTLANKHNLDLGRVVALGHSAGGHLALRLGSRGRPALAGIISLAGVADLRRAWELHLSNDVVSEFLGGSPVEVPDRYDLASPIERLPLGVPQKLVHGTADTSVPFEISRRYVSAAKARGDDAELITLENSGHFEFVDPQTDEFRIVRDVVLRMVGKAL